MKKELVFLLIPLLLLLLGSCHKSSANSSDSDTHEIVINFGGDIDLGDRYHQHRKQKNHTCIIRENGYKHSFIKIKPLLQSADLLVANLETPLYNKVENNKLARKKRYLHWCQPQEAIAVLKDVNFNYLNLANNHVLDQSETGLRKTINLLDSAKIEYFGAGDNATDASRAICLEKTVGKRRVYIIGGFEYRLNYDQNYQFYASENIPGVNNWRAAEASKQIKKLREKDPTAFIIAFPHWGQNYKWANNNQKTLGRELIDAGVDLIIGHGAHKFQEIEQYKERWIFYSLGNLVMNSPGRYDKMKALPYSFILKTSLRESNSKILPEFKLYPIFSNNKITNYQPHFVTEKEIQLIKTELTANTETLANNITIHKDEYGYYIKI
jgi:poly-gamma-glutamate capsule biosynthesis protein CapA/YwtB (metallophosphatase superfamily)